MRHGVAHPELVDHGQAQPHRDPSLSALDAVRLSGVPRDSARRVEGEGSRPETTVRGRPELEPSAPTRADGHVLILVPASWWPGPPATHEGTLGLREEVIT